MLPEHVEALKAWIAEDDYVERPEHSDWELQLIQEEIEIAYKAKSLVVIRTWQDGKILSSHGIIDEICLQSRHIGLTKQSGVERIPVMDVIGIQNMN